MIRGAVSLALLVACLLIVGRALSPVGAAGGNHPRQAVVYYEVGREGGGRELRFVVPRGVEEIRMETRLMLARVESLASLPVPTYNVVARLSQADGAALSEADLSFRAREGDAGPNTSSRLNPRASLRDPGLSLTDDRVTYLRLPKPDLGRRVLTVSWPEANGAPGLLRIYARQRLPEWERYLEQEAAETVRKEAQAREIGPAPWNLLSPLERERLVAVQWLRMEAEGVGGRDFETRAVWVDTRPEGMPDLGALVRTDLDAGHDGAWNVTGPGQVVITREDSGEGSSASGVLVDAIGGGDDPFRQRQTLRHCDLATRHARCAVTLPDASPRTLVLRASPPGPMTVRLAVHDGAAPLGEVTSLPTDDGGSWLSPDVRLLTVYRTAPTLPPVEFDLADPDGALVLVVARPVLPMPRVQADLRLTFRFEDAAGRILAEDTSLVSAPVSRFESYPDADAAERPTERVPLYSHGPPGATRLSLSADAPVDLQVYERQFWEDEAIPEASYLWDTGPGLVLRYPPMDRRRWQSVLPTDVEALWQEGRAVRLAAQVRLEPRGRFDGPDDSPRGPRVETDGDEARGRSIPPRDESRRQEILEAVPAERRIYLTDAPGLVAAVEPGRTTRLRLTGGAMTLHHRLAPTGIGRPIRVSVDGAPLGETRATSRLGLLSPGATSAGVHDVVVDGPPGRYFVAGAPTHDGTAVHRRYVVYELRRGQNVQVELPTRGSARFLNAVVYVPASAAPQPVQLTTLLDGGRPRVRMGRVVPRLSPGLQSHPLTSRAGTGAVFLDRVETSLGPPLALGHSLGEDLKPGVHTVDVRLDGGAEVAWVRFFVLDAPPEGEGPGRVRREGTP